MVSSYSSVNGSSLIPTVSIVGANVAVDAASGDGDLVGVVGSRLVGDGNCVVTGG